MFKDFHRPIEKKKYQQQRMKEEFGKAVSFLTNLIRVKLCGSIRSIHVDQLNLFYNNLKDILHLHYEKHWFPEKPDRGSGYRCVRINHKMDPIALKARIDSGINEEILNKLRPVELTMWVDPYAVSYRIGETGSICALFLKKPQDSQPHNPLNQTPPHVVNVIEHTFNISIESKYMKKGVEESEP